MSSFYSINGSVVGVREDPGPTGATGPTGPTGPTGAQGIPGPTGSGETRVFYAVDYGATLDGATDDRASIQSAIDACYASGGGIVDITAGTAVVTRNASNFYCLLIKDGVILRGAGQEATVVKQAPGIAASVRLIYTGGAIDAGIRNLTLDGNKATQSVNEHRHGVYGNGATRLLIERVTAQNFTGDGIYLHLDANQTTIRDCYCTANDRNGLTFGATLDDCVVEGSRFIGNAVQQVDSEPGADNVVSNIKLNGCTLDGAGVSNDYILTCSGPSNTSQSFGWSVTNCILNGAVFVVWCDDVSIAGNTGVNPTTKSCVTVYRSSARARVIGNTLEMTQTSTANVSGIHIVGTGVGDVPSAVIVAKNAVKMAHAEAFGIEAAGCQSVSIYCNELTGAAGAATLYAGIMVRATIDAAEPFRSASVLGNTVRNFGQYGVRLSGAAGARLISVDVSHNTFDDDSIVPTMTTGVRLEDGGGLDPAEQITLVGNRLLGGVSTAVSNFPATPVLVAGNHGTQATYVGSGVPSFVAALGSIFQRRDGSEGSLLYVNTDGDDTWVAYA